MSRNSSPAASNSQETIAATDTDELRHEVIRRTGATAGQSYCTSAPLKSVHRHQIGASFNALVDVVRHEDNGLAQLRLADRRFRSQSWRIILGRRPKTLSITKIGDRPRVPRATPTCCCRPPERPGSGWFFGSSPTRQHQHFAGRPARLTLRRALLRTLSMTR